MAYWEKFSEQEKQLLMALPYRAGLWVSRADDGGGEAANAKEEQELANIIKEKAKGMFESALMHEIIAETCAHESDWAQWSENLDAVPSECTQAVKIIGEKMTEKEVDALRAHVMGIGVAVAVAFREFDADASFFVKLDTRLRLFLEALIRILKRDKTMKTESELNISYEEDKALSALSDALYKDVA